MEGPDVLPSGEPRNIDSDFDCLRDYVKTSQITVGVRLEGNTCSNTTVDERVVTIVDCSEVVSFEAVGGFA